MAPVAATREDDRVRRMLTVLIAATLVLAGCAPAPGPEAPASPSGPPASAATPRATPTPSPTPTPEAVDALTLEQQVGQLFMVGTAVDAVTPAAVAAVTDRHVGSIFLHGRTTAGADATAAIVSAFTALVSPATTGDVPLWVATDQEGGDVQVVRGPGVDDIPYAIRQADVPTPDLRSQAAGWGVQLRAAGVNMNLAPVADIVSSHDARFDNPPIGALGRQYGYDEQTVADKAGAFAGGMRDAGVMPTFKHFPGLGRVSANTDYTAGVVDDVVGPDSPDVDVYRALTAQGPSIVMVGTAIYARIDPSAPAAFSRVVVTDLLRDDVGFDGVITTDDLSAAAAVQGVAPADRALRAVTAGIDLVLVSADPAVLPEMYDAVLVRARDDAGFAAQVRASAARVLAAKAWGRLEG